MKKLNLLGLLPVLLISVSASAAVLNPKNPDGFKQFRLDYAEMVDISSAARLNHRNFYRAPSTGAHAKWFDAVKQGDLATVKKMVKDGQNIEVKDEKALGQTALGWAAFIGYEDMVDYLLAQKADLFATDRADVSSAFKSAALGKNANIVKKIYGLLKDKIDLDDQIADMEGETVVMVAASNGRIDVVKYLIGQGADLNRVTTIKDEKSPAYNHSALSYACSRGLSDMVRLLSENGAINHRTGKATCE